MSGTRKLDTTSNISWQAQHLVSVLESGGSFAKVILFELCKNGVIKNSHEIVNFQVESVEFEGSLARNARFRRFLPEKLKMPRTKCSFWKLVVQEASHEMLVFDASYLKS